MPWVWLSLAVSFVAVAGSIAFVVVRTLAAWRGFRTFAAESGEATAAVTARIAVVEPKAEALGEGSVRLSESLERLARSRARLAVLSAALDDARASVNWLTRLVPRK